MASNPRLPPPSTYGATATNLLTTTVSLSSNQASFTILYPPPTTDILQYTTFPDLSNPSLNSTYTPSSLPILVLTNIIGIAVNPSGSPIATRTLSQTPPPQATNTNSSSSTSQPAPSCTTWNCWSKEKRIGICLGAGLGFLLILLLLWWLFFWRPRIKRIRVWLARPGDEEDGGGKGRPPLKIGVRTSVSQSRRKSGREESLTPSPPPMESGRIDGGIRVVAGSENEPNSYRVVKQPSVREFIRASITDAPVGRDLDKGGETRVRDFAAPIVAAAEGAGVASTARASRRGSRSVGDVKVSRGESMREKEGRGSRRVGRNNESGIELRERSERRSSGSYRRRDIENDHRQGDRRRDREVEGTENRRRRNRYTSTDEEDFEFRRDRSPRRRYSGREGDMHRSRSFLHQRRDRSKEKQKKRRDSEGGLGNGFEKLLPLLPLAFRLMLTYGEPKGGWNQYIPEEQRKGKGKLKKTAEDVFDKHHHRIPEDFPRPLHSHSPRSKSVDRAYRFIRPQHSPSPSRREDGATSRSRDRYRDRAGSARPVGNMRHGFNSMTPAAGSVDTTLTRSPPPQRRRSTRDRSWRIGGYDGVDDEDFVVYPAETSKRGVDEAVLPYDISES
ncbi:hypothetical protein BKA65DRAFT_584208 [Rhexocercosporidium sp. MPI-PUGE-AT-0058]|nr:hypothetical protein BKA65DRAFT_584208 [Rhexocercosporidium sp. MPI-PUGE-AT-0058]